MWWKHPYHLAIWPKMLHNNGITRGTAFVATPGMLAYGEHTDMHYHNVGTIENIYICIWRDSRHLLR
jgi:hypothetical protein